MSLVCRSAANAHRAVERQTRGIIEASFRVYKTLLS